MSDGYPYHSQIYELDDEMIGVPVHVNYMLKEVLEHDGLKQGRYIAIVKCRDDALGGTMNYPRTFSELKALLEE